MKRRRLLKLGLLILAISGGAIVNVVVAGIILYSNGGIQPGQVAAGATTIRRPLTIAEDQANRIPGVVADWRPNAVRGTPAAEEEYRVGWKRIAIVEEFFGPAGDDVRIPGIAGTGKTTGRFTLSMPDRVEAGLPWRSVIQDLRWGMVSGRRAAPSYADARPLWPGFAINTIFYAAILWLLFAAPFALRRRRRIKRGLCPACAYPVGESETCTECGRRLIADT
ncbi:MAG: hypothetical protein L0Y44_16240 [Phycisphaerales bacterium]|nr:hypothetical protein [Phycisphaerales bacterium]MCI0676266.1 hypothetical protein [Phycisphaerales bacterium]